MASVLILAHAPLASALKAVASHVYPERGPDIVALDVVPQATPEHVQAQAQTLMAQRPGADWLVLVDVFGATPCNAALRLSDPVHVRVLAGVNVAMLWRALCYADEPLDALVGRALAGAGQGIMPLAGSRPMPQQRCEPARAEDDHPHPQ
jgi:PTS system ascorbate-specific IIA component